MLVALFLPVLVIFIIGAIQFSGSFFGSPQGKQPLSDKDAAFQKRIYLTGIFILVAGLLASVLIYVNAPAEDDSGAIGYEIDGGTAVPIMPGDSKVYDREVEGVAGKVTILASEIEGLFHGRKLAYTLAFLSVAGALVCFYVAHVQAYFPPPDDH